LVDALDLVEALVAARAGSNLAAAFFADVPRAGFLTRLAAAGFGLDRGLRVIFGMIRVY
jgi:hypothetical protein